MIQYKANKWKVISFNTGILITGIVLAAFSQLGNGNLTGVVLLVAAGVFMMLLSLVLMILQFRFLKSPYFLEINDEKLLINFFHIGLMLERGKVRSIPFTGDNILRIYYDSGQVETVGKPTRLQRLLLSRANFLKGVITMPSFTNKQKTMAMIKEIRNELKLGDDA